MRVVVGRVGRAHGLGGEVAVQVRTDDPQARFAVGAVVFPTVAGTDSPGSGWPESLQVCSVRWHSGRLLLRFAQCPDRTAVEALAGAVLQADVDVAAAGDDPEEFHDLALIGLSVYDSAGTQLGQVSGVLHLPAQDVLVVRDGSAELLVPFVSALVPIVDLAGRRVVVDLPSGMEPESTVAADGQ